MFIDRVVLQLSAGRGGNGVIAWHRAKYIPKGGPAGGDGGNGGSLFISADSEIYSLDHLRNRRIIKAQNGIQGGSNNCKGKNGQDLTLKVPLGTLVRDARTNEVLFDLTKKGDSLQICRGGKGGKGNTRFKTSTHQAPYVCTEGTPGEEKEVELELKLIADIGLVGMPNAGKSTLISRLAHIAVKIAPYPFTTLQPNLGVLHFNTDKKALIADIPGIIENAHQNKGLGLSFLRHIERTSILVFLIELAPNQERDPFEEFQLLRRELQTHNSSLLEKPFLVVLNKIDLEGARELAESFKKQYQGNNLFEISALENQGLGALKKAMDLLIPDKEATIARAESENFALSSKET